MARLAKPRATRSDDDDDEFPDIDALVSRKKLQAEDDAPKARRKATGPLRTGDATKPPTTVRRRKLGPLSDNLLLRAWTPDSAEEDREGGYSRRENESSEPRRTRVELRTRKSKPTAVLPSSPLNQDEEYVSAQEEVTIIEDVSVFDDTFHSCNSEDSAFSGSEDAEEEDEDFLADSPPRRPPAKSMFRLMDKKQLERNSEDAAANCTESKGKEEDRYRSKRELSTGNDPWSKPAGAVKGEKKTKKGDKDLADSMSKLRLDETEQKPRSARTSSPSDQEATPPSTPPKPRLMSPKKLPRIPVTPHRPSSDMFWSQEFVDDWNDEHSPRKQLFPDAAAARRNSPAKKSGPEKKSQKSTAAKKPSEREAKKAFNDAKHDLAEKFLQELDTAITNGQLAELAASTGGIRLIWTNKLNTTAGRANWKRETIRTRPQADDTTTTKYKHHASIELAEKVIDDPHRLLNVLAHEFCHLANFMISGITTNPHGREFKRWAAQVSLAFAARGVQVTTKHSYDIDFKYVWACVACGTEFKRHSRSIDPARHRCGSCRDELRQIKPVPRKAGRKEDGGEGGGAEEGKKVVSEYQAFMKEQMRVVKGENPKSPQKEIMRIVAGRWAAKKGAAAAAATPDGGVKEVEEGLGELAV
ncbi:SprT-like family-domain-containing protein [Parachaetomium inaequale]|uniref:SprT-like family-domain-containing protein n=1 Tax=Parachaetomium inaequale TaxID=2588326 RepID=A0AAN6PA33_9PEZI|nr:SprT-like family-domain-containing protein [Parachaetomium inaequale]